MQKIGKQSIISMGFIMMLLYAVQSISQWSILEKYSIYKAFGTSIKSLAKDKTGHIYAAGLFKNDSGKQYVAKWNGTIWSELGGENSSTLNNFINSLVIDSQNHVYAAGAFTNSNGKYYIAKWNGSTWSELGGTGTSSFNGVINQLSIDKFGKLYAVGGFTNANGKQYVAVWNGTSWSELGGTNTSTFNAAIKNICVDNQGKVYVTGAFTLTGGFTYIACWNGNTWAEVVDANNVKFRNTINTMAINDAGILHIGGTFRNAKSSVYIATWDGSNWKELGGKDSTNFNINNTVTVNNIAFDSAGNTVIGVGSGSTQTVRFWNGTSWSILGGTFSNPTTSIITDQAGHIYATGLFKNSVNNFFVNKWDGFSWGELGVDNIMTLFKSGINAVATNANNTVFAAPRSTNDSGKNYVTYWDGTNWNELGGKNSSTFNNWVNAICFDNKGNLYAGGYFTNSKGRNYVARWNGTSWQALPWVVDSIWNRRILSLTSDNKGNVFAVTDYYVKKWNGSTWSTLDSGLFNFNGAFATDGTNIYVVENNKTVSKYSTAGNGGFLELGGANKSTFNNTINTLTVDAAGNLYAMGNFTNSNGKRYVAKWNGTAWSEVGGTGTSTFNNQIFAVAIDKKTNMYIGGFFKNDSSKNYVARWDGTSWSELGGKNSSDFSNTIYTLATDGNGNVYTGGVYSIKTAADFTSYVAKYSFTPATQQIMGNIKTPKNDGVKTASVIATGTTSSAATTNNSGNYLLNVAANGNVTLKPYKNDDKSKTNGVNTIDVALVTSHILQKTLLNSPYKLIAADVNGDGKITTLDVVFMRRLILGLDTSFINSANSQRRLWAFVDSSYSFPNPKNPFPFKDSISFTGLNANKTNQTFIGIKLGDVNWDWNANLPKGINQLATKTNTTWANKQEELAE